MVNVAGAAAASSKLLPIRGPGGARPRLLLAEDSKAARILTAALLRRMGCDVDAVEHGQDAVDLVQDRKYDLIMLDIEMPILDGVSAARQIRALGGEAGQTPLMALSAFLADSAKTDSWRNAFDHAIPKPAGRDELRAIIQAILDADCTTIRRMPALPARTDADVPLVDWTAANEIRAHLPREQWLEIVMTAETEIVAAVASMQSELGATCKRAHKIKGIAASFGLTRLAQHARRLEAEPPANMSQLRNETMQLMQIAVASMDQLRGENGMN